MELLGNFAIWVHQSYFDVGFDLLQGVEFFERFCCIACFPLLDVLNELFVVGLPDRNICCSQNVDQELGLTDGIDSDCRFGSDLGLEFPLEGEGCFEGRKDGAVWR